LQLLPEKKGAAGDLPAFKLSLWKDGLLPKLPAPAAAFGLDLFGSKVKDVGLKELAGLKNLQALNLRLNFVSDAGMKELAELKNLRTLNLGFTLVTDAGMKELARLTNLQSLEVFRTQVTDAGLKELAGLENLQVLDVGGTQVTDAGLKEAGVDRVYSPMGSNFGDLDNDGYLDFYLGTGDPNLSTLVPNRLFKNVAGKRFAEITASSRMGHLQKGHGVAFGDWDRDGAQDVFIQLGGAVHGDQYHNVLFQNPGQGNNWLSVKLVGKKTNRAAIGARIKVVTAPPSPAGRGAGGEGAPLTVHRHVSSGSSFGANPLEQHFGLGKADRVARLEIFWPTSGETQVFHDIAVNQGLVVTEFAKDYQKRSWKAIALPK
jgi:hypothetical protein